MLSKLKNKIVKRILDARTSLNKPHDIEFVRPIEMGDTIPRIVHQTYYTKNLPQEIADITDKLKEQNPEWEFRLYDDHDIENYIQKHYPYLLNIYKSINPSYGAAKADFFRYLVMYNEGGIYLDIKSGSTKPFDSIIEKTDKHILSHWPRSLPKEMQGRHLGISNPMGEYQQWHIISVKGHPFLKAVINNVCYNINHYNPIIHNVGGWGVINLTGPIAYSEPIYRLISQYPHRLVDDHLQLGLTYNAINTPGQLYGHRLVFKKKHYSMLTEPIVIQPLWINILYKLSNPLLKIPKRIVKSLM